MDAVTTLPRGRALTVADLEVMPDDGHRYEQAGIASYWIVDPAELSLRAFELRQGVYAEVANVAGDEQWTSETPYAVTIVPAELLG